MPEKPQPLTIHIWMPDARSLCDRRSHRRPAIATEMSDDVFESYLDVQTESPVCGACLVVAQYIRTEAGKLIAETVYGSRQTYPEQPRDAYESLADTRWALTFDRQPPREIAEASNAFYRDGIIDYFPEKWMRIAAAEAAERDADYRTRMTARRQRALDELAAEDQPADPPP